MVGAWTDGTVISIPGSLMGDRVLHMTLIDEIIMSVDAPLT